MADVFNHCEYCISYDTKTFFYSAASICGCISIIVPENGESIEEWQPNAELRVGVAYGFDQEEIEHSLKTRDRLLKKYEVRMLNNGKAVDYFVSECEKYWFG